MTKIEKFTLIFSGFLIFEVLFLRIGFIFGITISNISLLASFISYNIFVLASSLLLTKTRKANFMAQIAFILISLALLGTSLLFAKTYDFSWDGQGYHQTAVVALASGWNPVYSQSINLKQTLPSQIFAEGYPSAAWEIEASIYSLVGKINSAKVINLVFLIIAASLTYSLLKKLNWNTFLAIFTTLLIVLTPLYLQQFLTFMQDGLGYELVVMAASSLTLFLLDKKAYWSITIFIFTEIFLVSTKYNQLPLALIIGIIFMLTVVNRFINRDYILDIKTNLFILGTGFICAIFALVPYGRNLYLHKTPFYPTNIPALNGSVKYNNLPSNIKYDNGLELFLYGIFSKSQDVSSGYAQSSTNIAQLKIPFTFSSHEIESYPMVFNDRTGAAGPIFSGIVVVCVIILIIAATKAKTIKEKHVIYAIFFALAIVVFSSLIEPTPNLLRYVSQIELIPFIILIPIYSIYKKPIARIIVTETLFLILINILLVAVPIVNQNAKAISQFNMQLTHMKNSGTTYAVGAQQFYSNYILLSEKQIPYVLSNKLNCSNSETIYSSQGTTYFCNVPEAPTLIQIQGQ